MRAVAWKGYGKAGMVMALIRRVVSIECERLQAASGLAKGSLEAAHDFRVLSKSEYESLSSQVAEVRMMLHGLLRRLKKARD
jgi:hypothetical protein